ncbi:MAG: hypothetical protein JJLCMIEE_01999 [Acidimicrobiales bacterium]|nr:hypothetical protein [Acidimicrobiales bacterium]
MNQPRLPVVIGVGQYLNRVDRGSEPVEPVELMVEAARLAGADCEAPAALGGLEAISVVPVISWRYFDPGLLVAERLGSDPKETSYGAFGGNTPQLMLNELARAIDAGQLDLALMTGAEAWITRIGLKRKHATKPEWTVQPDDLEPTHWLGGHFEMAHPIEMAQQIFTAPQCYPLFEQAIRHQAGHSPDQHLDLIAQLWATFSSVAATNPYAWDRTAYTAEQIKTPTEGNRMIAYPYTKHMVANSNVEMGAAVLVASAARAAELGVPKDKWVFLRSGTDGKDVQYMSNRADFHSSPAMRIAGRRVLELAGTTADELAHVDLYSCFPSAVELAAAEIGFGLDRPLTVYGGLCFAGGPWNNPVTHAVATMTQKLREDPGTMGLVTANGGVIGKHAFGVYSTQPPPAGFSYDQPQDEIDTHPTREVTDEHVGAVSIETYTVMYERDGSRARAHAACLTPEGVRAWAVSEDDDLMRALEADDMCGRPARIGPDRSLLLD